MRIPRSRMRGINHSDTYRNQQFDIDAGNTVGLSHGLRTPATPLDPMPISSDDVPDLDLGPASHVGSYFRSVGAVEKGPGGVPQVVVDIGAPPSAFHYQLKKPIRVPYMEEKVCCTLKKGEISWIPQADPSFPPGSLSVSHSHIRFYGASCSSRNPEQRYRPLKRTSFSGRTRWRT